MEDHNNSSNNNHSNNNNSNNSSNSKPGRLMDDGELEFSNQELLSSANLGDIPCSGSMDSFFDELLRDSHACTHTHTCNPPGPDFTHTHTCFHVHTKIVPPPSEEKSGDNDDSAESEEKKSKKRADRGGNREAVRKYRQKKKAHAASLEDEVVKLRALNQHLLKRLQGQMALEKEVARLKCLLVDIRGRIEGEIGAFPYQRPVKSGDMYQNITNASFPGSYAMNPCNVPCSDQLYCLHPGVEGNADDGAALNNQCLTGCEYENLDCMANLGSVPKELLSCGATNVAPVSSSGNKKRKANHAA